MSDKSTKGKLRPGYGHGYGEGSLLCDEFHGGSIENELGRCHFPSSYNMAQISQDAFGEMEHNTRRIAASWNALAHTDLEALERDGMLADPRVAALVEAAKEAAEALTSRTGYGDEYTFMDLQRDEKAGYALMNALRALEGEGEIK